MWLTIAGLMRNMCFARPLYALSKANGRIATMASRMGEARTEREISLWVYEHNRTCDENRGVSKRDFLRNFWEEEKLRMLSGNVKGPHPGGNLLIPPEVGKHAPANMYIESFR